MNEDLEKEIVAALEGTVEFEQSVKQKREATGVVRKKGAPLKKEWNVLGQNPPDGWSQHSDPVGESIEQLRRRERLCPVGGCSHSWRGDLKRCKEMHDSEHQRTGYYSIPLSPRPTRPKKTGVYPDGPLSPSMSPRKTPKWGLEVERTAGEDNSMYPAGLYYPSSPLETGRYTPPKRSARVHAMEELVTLEHFSAEKQRLQRAALEFYRASGRLPIQPHLAPPKPEDTRVQQVLNGTYSPSRKRENQKNDPHVKLTPSVHLDYSPQRDPVQSDAFFPPNSPALF